MARTRGSITLARTLTVQSLNLDPRVKEGDAPKPLMRIFGVAHTAKEKATTFGTSWNFLGDFEFQEIIAENSVNEDGTPREPAIARGNSCYLPGHAEAVLLGALSTAGGSPVSFALEIYSKYRKVAGKDSYEYTVREVGGITAHDPLAHLKQLFLGDSATVPAIAAPREAAELPAPNAGEPVNAEAEHGEPVQTEQASTPADTPAPSAAKRPRK